MLIALELFLLPLAKLLVSIPAVDSRMLLLPRSLKVKVELIVTVVPYTVVEKTVNTLST